MAGNKVTLTFAGDSSDLERSFDRVGTGSKNMGRDVGDSFDRVGESADNLDTRAMGFRDTMTGVEDTGKGLSEIMKGNLFEGTLLLGMGFGDLASGVANFGVQFARQIGSFVANTSRMVASHAVGVASTVAGWVLMGVQSTLAGIKMAAAWLIGLGPIGLVILAVGAVIGILLALGIGFDDVKAVASAAWTFILDTAKGVWNWLSENWPLLLAILTGPFGIAALLISRNWDSIKAGATGVKDWIVTKFGEVVSFFQGLPGVVTSAFSSVGSSIVDGIKGVWNSTVGGFGFTVPSWVPGVGGRGFHIPSLHQGGIVPGAPGSETLALLQAGERVTPAGRAGGATIVVNVNGSVLSARELVGVIADAARNGAFRGVL
jgi:hypothetical protein